MSARLVLVRDEEAPPELQHYIDLSHVSFVRAPRGSSRAGMCDAAMPLAKATS